MHACQMAWQALIGSIEAHAYAKSTVVVYNYYNFGINSWYSLRKVHLGPSTGPLDYLETYQIGS